MDKRLWINIGLITLILLLSFILLNTGKETKQELPRLSTIDQNDILQIKVLRRELENFTFNKQGARWHMNSPQQFLANDARINAMLRILKTESHSQLDPAEVSLASFGLSEPTIIMKLNDHEIKFGTTDAIDQRRYVLFNRKIHLTNDFLYNQLMTNATFFADTKLLPEGTEINAIQFPENKIELIDNQWQMQTLMDISPDQLKRIIFAWENTTALTVSKYDAPELESLITISTNKKETIYFVIVSTDPHLILGRKDIDIQYSIGSNEAKKLLLNEDLDLNDEAEPFDLELH